MVKVLLPEAGRLCWWSGHIRSHTISGTLPWQIYRGGRDIAIRYSRYHRYQTDMMMVTEVLLVIIVQLIQEVAMPCPEEIRESGRKNPNIIQEERGRIRI